MATAFYWENHWVVGDVVSDSEAPLFPATNTQIRWPAKVWRSADASSSHYLTCDRGTSVSGDVECLIIQNNNFSSSATVKIQANSVYSWTSPPLDITLTVASTIYYRFTSPQSYTYWRILITDTSNPYGYYEISHVYLGPEFSPERNINYGASFSFRDLTNVSTTELGYVGGISKGRVSVARYVYKFLPASDKIEFERMFKACGVNRYLFFAEDVDYSSSLALVRLTGFSCVNVFSDLWNVDIEMEKVL